MVDEREGKALVTKVVQRFKHDVEGNPQLIKDRLLSEQDITTKFVLPMLKAFNWDCFKINANGPEVHEKAFREKSNVGEGLPDIQLRSDNGTVFVEAKRPGDPRKGLVNLERHHDADVIVLTTFRELEIYTRLKQQEPRERRSYNFKQYAEKFDELWANLSNTKEGKKTRAAFKATR